MSTLVLSQTLGAVLQEARGTAHPEDLLRCINGFPNCHWHFASRFPRGNQVDLYIHIDPQPAPTDLRNLLDGRCPGLFVGQSLHIDVPPLKGGIALDQYGVTSRETDIDLDSATPALEPWHIVVCGIPEPLVRFLQQENRLTDWLQESTWLGTPARRPKRATFEIFAESTVVPQTRSTFDFTVAEQLQGTRGESLGHMYISFSEGTDRTFRHTVFGDMPSVEHLSPLWDVLRKVPLSVTVAVDTPSLHWYNIRGPFHNDTLRTVVEQVTKRLPAVLQREDVKAHLRRKAEEENREVANRITARQTHLQKAPRVAYDGEVLFRIPASENELVALFMKLDALKALPFDCTVLEYTSRRDVDALGSFRLRPTDAFQPVAPIEFEYSYQNYFDHGHFPGHCRLIVCWTDDLGESANGANWLRYLEHGDQRIPVVVVSRLPDLQIVDRA